MNRSFLLLAALSVFCACSGVERESPAEIQALIRDAGPGDVVIVDVRPASKFAEGHIAGAMNIPLESETFERRVAALDRGRRVIFYCGTGLKTDKAAETARRLGFGRVYVLEGGVEAWKGAGLALSR